MGGSTPQTTTTNQSQNQTYSQLQNLIENLATQGTSASNATTQNQSNVGQQTAGTQTGATTGQTATTQNPWAPAVPALSNLISAVGAQGYGLTPEQQAALTSYNAAAGNVPGFGQPGANAVTNLFNSQNGVPQAGMLGDAYNSYKQTVAPFLSPDWGSINNPAINQMINDPNYGLNKNIATSITSEFAGAGRVGNGPNGGNADLSKAIAGAESQADLPILLNNQNTLAGQQLGAASGAFGAGNTAATGETNLLQTPLMNSIAGLQQAGAIPGLWTAPSTTALGAANTAYSLPYANIQSPLSQLSSLASLGGQTTGQQAGTTTGATTGTMTGQQTGGTVQTQQGQTANTTAGTSQGNTSGQSQGTAQGTQTTTPAFNPISTFGGLGLGLLALSDERLKENIEPVGLLNNGLNIYRYNFKGDSRPQIGVMAQEVEQVKPEAVANVGMWKFVDYGKATQPLEA